MERVQAALVVEGDDVALDDDLDHDYRVVRKDREGDKWKFTLRRLGGGLLPNNTREELFGANDMIDLIATCVSRQVTHDDYKGVMGSARETDLQNRWETHRGMQ